MGGISMAEQKIPVEGLELFWDAMQRKGITRYQLVKLTGIKKPTLYAYFEGRGNLSASVCAILADAIGEEVCDVFPQIRSKTPELASIADSDYDPVNLSDKTKLQPTKEEVQIMEEKGLKIAIEDMMAGAANLIPEDGVTLKSRLIQDLNDYKHDSLLIQPETQVIIYTGIKALGLPVERLVARDLKKHIIEHECHVVSTPFTINGELCVALYNHGKPLMCYRGKEVCKLILV